MYKKISRSEEIIARLTIEGKVKSLDSPEDLQKMKEMNKYMAEVRMDYINKSRRSEESASRIYFKHKKIY